MLAKGAQSIGRLTQAAPLLLALEPQEEIRDVFVVGCAFVAPFYGEALEVFG